MGNSTVKRVESFENVNLDEVECISFVQERGIVSYDFERLSYLEKYRLINQTYQFAFVNLLGRAFLVVLGTL
ncbi:hypothetical protein J1N10_17500 [Carboxylicivirga sp. A043]|uniref:hypothetical protein n=1 Tax=Carboxylicivirga litoralis TaxID=2816963 RepID=UPI0021CB55F4|nr:hypothetical protein [Carboxylicivirga sp. A043]MCU4157775.1 hypothetical protein [Carboxylicivirga sp. A043]